MIDRPTYLAQASAWFGKPVIKVLIGLRRCGKSVLLRQIAELARNRGFAPGAIHLLDMERLENDPLRTAAALHATYGDRPPGCLLIDEVQSIVDWERALASLLAAGWEIWITGSNAHLLASELATLLTGRYVEIQVFPLSLAEFRTFRPAGSDPRADLDLYLRWGGLPGLHALGFQEELCREYLRAVFESILLKDVVARFAVRNVPLLERLARFVASSVGSPLSALSIARFLKSQRLAVNVETVQGYLSHLESALLATGVPQWDVRGKRHLEYGAKYYLGDNGLFVGLLDRPGDINSVLENLVYLELRRRGCRVSVGRSGSFEIDFWAERAGQSAAVQVCYLAADAATLERELRPLRAVSGVQARYLLTLDPLPPVLPDAVAHVPLADFLGGASPAPGVLAARGAGAS
jgi:predicted AAA+ superfamily ATPase